MKDTFDVRKVLNKFIGNTFNKEKPLNGMISSENRALTTLPEKALTPALYTQPNKAPDENGHHLLMSQWLHLLINFSQTCLHYHTEIYLLPLKQLELLANWLYESQHHLQQLMKNCTDLATLMLQSLCNFHLQNQPNKN